MDDSGDHPTMEVDITVFFLLSRHDDDSDSNIENPRDRLQNAIYSDLLVSIFYKSYCPWPQKWCSKFVTNVSAFPSFRSDSEDHLAEANSGKPSSLEPNCASPTIISCSRHVQDQEGNRVLSDRTCIVSNSAPQISSETGDNIDKLESKAEDDRSFTFEFGSRADLSKKHPGSGWKPFPSMQTSELPKVIKD